MVPASNRWSRSAAAAAQGWKENDGKYGLRTNRAPAGALAEASFIGRLEKNFFVQQAKPESLLSTAIAQRSIRNAWMSLQSEMDNKAEIFSRVAIWQEYRN